ncbi:MAG: DUF5666 domain-containing protein [Patescibacteria group bacterium]
MEKNKKIIALIVVLLLIGASFYGGMLYGKSKIRPAGFANVNGGQFIGGQRTGAGMRGISGFTVGEIIAKDATSVTVKMPDGSSKIVLVSDTTKVLKSTDGSLNDLAVGTSVSVTGTANSDKSVTATSIQIRPAGQTTTRTQPQ